VGTGIQDHEQKQGQQSMTIATVGAAKITRIEETYGFFFEAKQFFADWRDEIVAEHMSWMVPDHYDPKSGYLKLSIHSWLLEVGGKKILIDTCVGNHKSRKQRPFWDQLNTPYVERLAAAGAKPEEIDMVMCTHLHVDHVGWNTKLEDGRWVPTFPNAKYVWSKTDFDHFSNLDRDPEKPAIGGAMRDSVYPIVEAGLAQMVDGTETIEEHLSLTPAPGHSPGHVLINLTSQGKQAYFSGDIIHHMIQIYQPTWNSFACVDQQRARASRRMTLERCAGSGALLLPQHFGAPHICLVDANGDAFTPRFVG
jgi:glyoxylase-like metal-dependent hydrolase (beta-lactamase superfamily II)